MVASAEYAAYLKELLAPLGVVSVRRMFGKSGVFCEGVMFGIITANVLYLRVDEQNKAAFAEATKSPSINYKKGGKTIDLTFWRLLAKLRSFCR
jgi:DNA transformation protein